MRYADYVKYYKLDVEPADYYAEIAKIGPRDPQATSRTKDTDVSLPGLARDKMFNISAEIKNWFHEPGAPIPPLMDGLTVVDLFCGSGRDTYLAAQLVGSEGKVIGVEPNAKRLAIAEKYLDAEIKQFGYDECNVELVQGYPEDLSFIADESVDLVISNCMINLSPDKDAIFREVFRILKNGGEFYFTDVFTDRRMQHEISHNMELRAMRLGGAMYINDFRRIVQEVGFINPRYPICFKTPVTDEELAKFDGTAFATLTCRLMKTDWESDVCETYTDEWATYKGNLPDYPDMFLYDYNIKFPTGARLHVCNNVTCFAKTRYAACWDIEFNRERHEMDTHGDHIIKTSPDYDGVYDEDDQPIQASCC